MTTGEGIFWGSVVLGLVVLFAVTKDRWKWPKIAKWTGFLVFAHAVIIGLWIGGAQYLDNQPKVEAEFWGLKPGMEVAEVLFKKGKADKEEDDYWVWKEDADLEHFVQFKEGRVRLVGAWVRTDNYFKLPSIQGISNYSDRGCKNFCVNGQLAGNCCTSMELHLNDRHERIDRQPAG